MQSLWNELFYKPIFNLLVYIMDVLPDHSFGLSIIIITIIVRLIVLLPSQKAIRSQRALQEIQPEIQALKEKYKANPQVQAQKTMELYKKNNINPFGSCLPLLIQFPILIALFWVSKNLPDLQLHLNLLDNASATPEQIQAATDFISQQKAHLYASLQSFDFHSVKTTLFGIDLINKSFVSMYIMPIIVGLLQFVQMYTMQSRKAVEVNNKKKKTTEAVDPQMVQKMMMYFLPIMITFFASRYPAGLSLYWAISTIFSIAQQQIVFHMKKQ